MKHTLRITLAALLSLLAASCGMDPVFAQTAPATMGYHTVYGRIGAAPGDSGPGQDIPFATLAPQIGLPKLPEIYATSYGVKCDGITPDSTALQLAINTADSRGGGTVILPAGTCVLNSNIFLNKWTSLNVLTVPGLKLKGQGRGVTILDTRAANDFAISVNPAWRAAHQALFGIAASTTGGTLATNTYYVQITMNDNLGNEIYVTSPKSIAVTGATGSISITLPAVNTGYSYNIHLSTTAGTPTNYATFNGGNASAVAGNQSGTISAIGTARTVPTTKLAVWQEASVSDLSVTNSTAAVNASGVSFFKAGYSDLTNVYMKGLTGDGFGLAAYTGDNDGSFNVAIHNSKFDSISGTCVNAAGNVLETSNFTVDDRTVFNICGTLPTVLNVSKTISAISNSASSVVTTSSAHNWVLRDQIYISGVTGMTLADGWFRVCGSVGSATFNLCDLNGTQIDTTSLGSYTASSGAGKLAWRPPFMSGGVITGGGGCLAWTGLIGTFRNLDFTQCNNFAIYFTEAGASDNATIENVDLENTAGKGLYAAALAGGSFTNSECLSATALGATISCAQLGTGLAAGGVYNFKINNIKVRTDVTPAVGFEQFGNTNLTPGSYPDQVRASSIAWQSFDAAGQTRFSGFTFDPIPGQVKFSVSATNTFKLIPTGLGSTLPLHLKATGEWIAYAVPDAGITAAATTSSPNTTYNIYATNSAPTSFPYVIAFSADTVAPVLNKGYSVRASATTHVLIGTATTDGSGNFQPGNAQTSQFPPGASVATSSLTGTLQAAQEPAHTGDCTNSAGSLALTCLNTNGAPFTGPATAAYAAKTNMQTPSSSVLVVNPRDVQDHPGVAKFAGRLDGKTGATCAVTSGYNIASCSRSGVGTYNVVFTTAFAAATYSLSGSAYNTGVSTGVIAPAGAYATGNVSFFCINLGTNAAMDCDIMNIQGFGAQ